jgi:hypothetical protein
MRLYIIIDNSKTTVSRLLTGRGCRVILEQIMMSTITKMSSSYTSGPSIKNPQANAILDPTHGVLAEMLSTSGLDKFDTVTDVMITDFLNDAAWAIHSTYHTVIRTTPGTAIFGRDM